MPVTRSGRGSGTDLARCGSMAAAHPDDSMLGPVVVSAEDIAGRIAELGKQITADYAGQGAAPRGGAEGCVRVHGDLARAIDLPVEFDFMAVSSYGAATRSSGVVRIVKDLDVDLTDRHVLLVEDIIDSGLTLQYLRRNLKARHPASLEVCALLVREGLQKADLRPGVHRASRIPPDFVVGYGLDWPSATATWPTSASTPAANCGSAAGSER